MVILRDSQGRPVVKVPGSEWYEVVETGDYERDLNLHYDMCPDDLNYDSHRRYWFRSGILRNTADTIEMVKRAIKHNDCVRHYGFDTAGQLVNNNMSDAIDVSRTDLFDLREGDFIPLMRSGYHEITIKNNEDCIEIDGCKWRDMDFVVRQMIEYMDEHLSNSKTISSSNNVNHPLHYNHGGTETIEVIKERLSENQWNAYEGGLLFNVYKYIDRAPYKGKLLEDLKKAQWYLNKLIEENEERRRE